MERNKSEPAMAWLFDVDGVLTDPEQKRIVIPEIVDELVKRLDKGEPIGLDTGRSLEFMIREILVPIEKKIGKRNLLKNIFAVGENGGVQATYDNVGKRNEQTDEQLKIPVQLKEAVKELVSKYFSDIVFFDEEKRTLITLELNKNQTVKDFDQIKQKLTKLLKDILLQMKLDKDFTVDSSRIAIDVHHKGVDKGFGARVFLKLLDRSYILPKEFTEFGDSLTDYEIDKELKSQGKKTVFVFVGDKCDKGTFEYLRSH